MKKLTLDEVQPFKHYWMYNTTYDKQPIWRIVYTIEDEIYPYGPKNLFLLLNGDSKHYPKEYFQDKIWQEVFFIEIETPKV